jgi:L,D-peptidoglycan transpeptidase YkuD (ErfK/YbiS/YcfS/YnhG family)
MKPRVQWTAVFSVLFLFALSGLARAGESSLLTASTQLVIVTTADWGSVSGQAQLFEKHGPRDHWRRVGDPFEIVVGNAGLAWGAGVLPASAHDGRAAADPVKKEGDGKAPAGIFRLSKAFGYAPQPPAGSKLDYVALSPSIECVDDAASRYYNRIEDHASVTPDWHSSEQMRRPDDLYRWGIVVDHNSDPPQPGAGSCIFLHIWRGPGQGTVGCTAVPQARIESLLGWLDPARQPLLVQLPRPRFDALRKQLHLPKLKKLKRLPSHSPAMPSARRYCTLCNAALQPRHPGIGDGI